MFLRSSYFRLSPKHLGCFLLLCLLACGNGDQEAGVAAIEKAPSVSQSPETTDTEKITLAPDADPCTYITSAHLSKILNVPIDFISAQAEEAGRTCTYRITYDLNQQQPDITTSSVSFTAASALTADEWRTQKTSKGEASEFIPKVGQAAIWQPASRQLHVKFSNYTLTVIAPRGPGGDDNMSQVFALEMLRKGGFI